ncbi:hypothetical protein CIHG_03185 [Coccidioides immitis H538.4]|uniref:Uncharacterized protein n=1 Tax=Coccidioides immitis H538.4 TaxID=396776 RepID=A0A0J8UDN8_COCIT|nr:hypothetical protein CIHG_03185 [Coccidioides immitis H538.4]
MGYCQRRGWSDGRVMILIETQGNPNRFVPAAQTAFSHPCIDDQNEDTSPLRRHGRYLNPDSFHTAREFYHIAHSPGPSGRRRKGKRVKRNEAPPESEESEWPPGEKGWRLRARQPMRRPDVGENLSRSPGVDHPPPQIPPLHGAARREPM